MGVSTAARQAIEHWNHTPLNTPEEVRYHVYPWLYEAAEFRSHRGERVLEVGCGAGCDLLQFVRHGAIATGIDITPGHLRLASQRLGNRARLCLADATSIPFEQGAFDYVYSHGVVHHIPDARRAIQEILRVLRPGGRFNIQLYAFWSLSHLQYRLRWKRTWKLHVENSIKPVHLDLYTGRKVRNLLSPVAVEIRKYEFHCAQMLSKWLGWFIVAKGSKP